jgi:hypothetical protein
MRSKSLNASIAGTKSTRFVVDGREVADIVPAAVQDASR